MGHCLTRADPVIDADIRAVQVLHGYNILFQRAPYPAWRLLMDYLQDDRGFCHCVIPHFHTNGDVTIHIAHKEPTYVRDIVKEQ